MDVYFGAKMKMAWKGAAVIAALTLLSVGNTTDLSVELGAARGSSADAKVISAAKSFAKNAATLTKRIRSSYSRAGLNHREIPFSLPSRVFTTVSGRRLAQPSLFSPIDAPIVLDFDATGPNSFPSTYQQLLEDTFAQAESTLIAVFGNPAVGGTIKVRNFDASISDREAVTGGIYVPDNGSGGQEILFPIYSNDEAAAVNFVHCLLLAHLGPNTYGSDGLDEGLVRAATMRVVRTAGALPVSLDPQLVESVLDNTYDAGTYYDWWNQRALGAQTFIAPNLRTTQLPAGGSVGGLYLLRYQMAGSAWQKAIAEYPGFISGLNQALYANPGMTGDRLAILVAGQNVINTLAGSGSATLEGRSFAAWFDRQHILNFSGSLGNRLLVQPVPLPPETGTSDFGVFDVVAHYFQTISGGNEILLSGTSYPIFWTPDYNRIFPSTQEDRMDIAGAYGSVAPNLPNLFSGAPYRCAIDIPVQDRIARAYVPSGAIATGANPTANDFFGTVIGFPASANLKVRLTYGVTTVNNIPVENGAFKFRVNTSGYLGYARCRVEVIETVASVETTVIDRFINKGPGSLAVDMRKDLGDNVFTFTSIPKGLSTLGFAVDPYDSDPADVLGVAPNSVLVARWNGSRLAYDIWPDTGSFVQGNGYFVRSENALTSVAVSGSDHPGQSVGVALRSGWNLISNPKPFPVAPADILVVKTSDALRTYSESLGTLLGTTFFEFTPGANDPASGAPETGTMTAATTFEPGKAYFVRVLNAEGLTLLFEPSSSLRGSSAMRDPEVGRQLSIRATQIGKSSVGKIGQAPGATTSFDPAFDSGLPPGMGGIQVLCGAGGWYLDMRSDRLTSVFPVSIAGLRRGVTARIQTETAAGSFNRFYWRRKGTTVWNRASQHLDFSITPTQTTAQFEFKLEATR